MSRPAFLSRRHRHMIESGDLVLLPPRDSDYQEWCSLRFNSRAFLQPWEPKWPGDDLTRPAYRARVRRYQRDMRLGLGVVWLIHRKVGSSSGAANSELVGGISMTGIRRGVMQCATLGYWIGEPFTRQGIARNAVQAAIEHGRANMSLSRFEAATLPDNEASMGLLQGLGFEQEGRAKDYLRINGTWRDHILFALTKRS
jgi:ribosomal-protein-alanine N-acetyltransferase